MSEYMTHSKHATWNQLPLEKMWSIVVTKTHTIICSVLFCYVLQKVVQMHDIA